MNSLVRFGVSLEKGLLDKFDRQIRQKNYPTRSKALSDLIRENIVRKEWVAGKKVAGTISLVFNHHRRELVKKLTNIQHDYHQMIISTQHIHLDHDNCLEVIIVKGKSKEIERLAQKLKATKGVIHTSLNMTTTGKEI